ncbi:MAG: MATE family efflux transporter [Gammaproteobacteria bacterium]|nr:MATE family efflux transporter [Gammaproteobacteria bacterium]
MPETVRTSEIRELLRLGLPIMAAQTFQMGMGVTDTLMAGRYSAIDLAGVALAWGMAGPVTMLIMGILFAITPVVAQLFGAGRRNQIGAVIRQAVWLAAISSALGIAIVSNLGPVFDFIGAEQAVADVSRGYLKASIWGYPGFALYFVFRNTCEGMGKTRPAMVVASIAFAINVPLNYMFVYGHFGAPELGGIGCGVATAIVSWLECIAMFVVITGRFYRGAEIFSGSWKPDIGEFARLARVGVPIGITTFLEMGLFSLVTLLLAQFGANPVAAHSIAMNINGVAFMIPLSLGMAASIRVGHSIGAGDFEKAREVGKTAVRASLVFAAGTAAVLFVFRFQIAGAFSQDADLVAIAANVLMFVAGYQFVDDPQAAAIGVLRGYKDTRVPMILAFIGYWAIALPVALFFGFGVGDFDGWGIYGFWIGLVAGIAFVAVTTNIRRVRLGVDVRRIRMLAADGVEA